MLRGWLCVGLFLALPPLQAQIYQCTTGGETLFSDSPCSDQAETITIDIRQPDQQAIEKQQSITATFQEESRFNQIRQLNQHNDELEAEIIRLQQQREEELALLRQKTYTTGDGRIVTREHGLFDRINRLDALYQQKIEQVLQTIRGNEKRLQMLYLEAADNKTAERE